MADAPPPGRCDACSRANVVLYKISLGHDFFERTYNRLSVVDDQDPRWYCEECSREKTFQRDVRSIRDEFQKLGGREGSLLADLGLFRKAHRRVAEIDHQMKRGRSPHVILAPRDSALLLMELDRYAEEHDMEGNVP